MLTFDIYLKFMLIYSCFFWDWTPHGNKGKEQKKKKKKTEKKS